MSRLERREQTDRSTCVMALEAPVSGSGDTSSVIPCFR